MVRYTLQEGESYRIGCEGLKSGLYRVNVEGPFALIHTDGREVSMTTTHGPNAIGLTQTVVRGLVPVKPEDITPEIRTWLRTVSTSWSRGLTGLARQLAQSQP